MSIHGERLLPKVNQRSARRKQMVGNAILAAGKNRIERGSCGVGPYFIFSRDVKRLVSKKVSQRKRSEFQREEIVAVRTLSWLFAHKKVRPLPFPRRSANHHAIAVKSGCRRLFEPLGYIQFDLTIAGFIILHGCRQVQAKPLRRVVGKNDSVAELERLIKDLAEKIWIHSEIDDHFVGSLRNAADIRVAGLDAGGIDLDLWRGGLGFVGHNPESKWRSGSISRPVSRAQMNSPRFPPAGS
jgi:hypothetical protein